MLSIECKLEEFVIARGDVDLARCPGHRLGSVLSAPPAAKNVSIYTALYYPGGRPTERRAEDKFRLFKQPSALLPAGIKF